MSLRMPSRSRSRSTLRQPAADRPAKLTKSRPSSRPPSRAPSRTCSPVRLGRKPSKLDLYRSKSSRRNSSVNVATELDHLPTGMQAKEIKRWDGIQRTTFRWDSLRRDPELWLHNGDCLVHLHERGSSRRGAALRVSLADLESSNCRPLLNAHEIQLLDPAREPPPDHDRSSRFSGYFEDTFPQYELFLPAPSHLSRDEALQYHITTRNFFAWMYNRPLVGDRLGQALIRLQKRMGQYRPDQRENEDNLLAFLEDQGYSDFRHCPDHALALLQYAEHFQYRDLWTDAFVHCAGMSDELDTSCEFETVSRASQALITRAHIEMDIRLDRAGRALETFLENDIPGPDFPLNKQAQANLERFRSFLQCHYVGRYGYWPPALNKSATDALPKPVYQSMYFDLRNLYEYLANKSFGAEAENTPPDHGLNVLGIVRNFDAKNKYAPLLYPLALSPSVPEPLQRRRSIWNIFSFGPAKKERRLAAFAALKAATNHDDHRVMSSSIVREYLRFERDWTMSEDPTASFVEARKVRWILVYAMLQVLVSIARVPDEVRDTEGVTYPLCCQTAGTPPWSETKPELVEQPKQASEMERPVTEVGVQSLADLRPDPLRVPTGALAPQQNNLPVALPLEEPKPIRTSSIDFLDQARDGNLLAPPAEGSSRLSSLRKTSTTTLTTPTPRLATSSGLKQTSAGDSASVSDPSTPTSSEMGGSGGWSGASSEDGMDHQSVGETDSNYGDDEGDGDDTNVTLPKPRQERLLKKVPSGGSMSRCNPEVDAFLST